MINPTTISEVLLFSTVRIEVEFASGEKGTGTGFFFDFPFDEHSSILAIITNKHVVAGAIKGQFQVHEAENMDEQPRPSGHFFTLNFEQFESRWIPHPDDEVDLCAMLFARIATEAEKQGKHIFALRLDDTLIQSDSALEELRAVEEVLMVGYPIGLWDEVNNFPIIRRGITATHPAVDFRGKSIGIIDVACFPGSSGSPILLVNEGSFSTKSGLTVGNRAVLLGVLSSAPTMTAEGKIEIKDIPTIQHPVSVTNVMIHLGYIIKAKEIRVLGEHIKKCLQVNTPSTIKNA